MNYINKNYNKYHKNYSKYKIHNNSISIKAKSSYEKTYTSSFYNINEKNN